MESALINLFIFCFVVLLVAAITIMLIRRAPFIESPFKGWLVYAVYFFAGVLVIFRLLGFIGVG